MTTVETEKKAPEIAPCLSVIGIGRTGAVYVEALLRTGEIEDCLANPDATVAALVIDIGDDDMSLAQDYGASFYKRLETRGIPTDRFLFQSVALDVPTEKKLRESLSHMGDFLKADKTKLDDKVKLEPYLPKKLKMPKAGEHFPRAIAKAIYADAYHSGERPIDVALTKFVEHVEKAKAPADIAVCCSLAGGTGTGMLIDLSCHLVGKLKGKIPVIGVGQLPHTGDPETYKDSAALYTALNDIDCMLDEEKNAAITAKYGDGFKSPFTGGFFVVNPEQSWQRLTAYTTTGEARIRQAIKEMVTNRFVADSFMRWCVINNGKDLMRVLQPAGKTDGAHETVGGKARNWTLFDVAKLTHPGVQVLPGEAPSKWDAVLTQWIGFTPKYAGLKEGFKTDFAHVALYGSRNMGKDAMTDAFVDMMKKNYLLDDTTVLPISFNEFFDVLTAYANVVLLGVAKTDLTAFWASQKTFDKLSGEEKLKEHSFLIDVGPMLSDPKVRFDGLPSQCATDQILIPVDTIRGDTLPPPNRKAEVTASA